jgi:hypothetical protein
MLEVGMKIFSHEGKVQTITHILGNHAHFGTERSEYWLADRSCVWACGTLVLAEDFYSDEKLSEKPNVEEKQPKFRKGDRAFPLEVGMVIDNPHRPYKVLDVDEATVLVQDAFYPKLRPYRIKRENTIGCRLFADFYPEEKPKVEEKQPKYKRGEVPPVLEVGMKVQCYDGSPAQITKIVNGRAYYGHPSCDYFYVDRMHPSAGSSVVLTEDFYG